MHFDAPVPGGGEGSVCVDEKSRSGFKQSVARLEKIRKSMLVPSSGSGVEYALSTFKKM